jgi:hypothetical protein
MQRFEPSNRRLDHCAERWPNSNRKQAVLAAIRSTIKTLEASRSGELPTVTRLAA